MEIRQGDVFWIDVGEPSGSAPGFLHPHVVIQNDVINETRISTVITCVISTNIKLASARGNVLLHKGEANLPRSCVVNVSQIYTLDKRGLTEHVGTLSKGRVRQIVDGLYLLLEPREYDNLKKDSHGTKQN
jgi:mRNA interferase MazF